MPFFVTGYNPDSNFETSGYQTLCELQYHAADPLYLSLIFERNLDDQGEPKKWIIDRGLVTEGLAAEAGTADVIISPHKSDDSDSNEATNIAIQLSSPEGKTVLLFPRNKFKRFLKKTQEIVRPDSEREQEITRNDLERFLANVSFNSD